jgi:hypothetical protein
MALELNEQHIEILTEVRERLRNRLLVEDVACDGGEFICVQVLRAIGRKHGVEEAKSVLQLPDSAEVKTLYYDLTREISAAIGQLSSMGIYVYQLKLNRRLESVFQELAPLARLAWLDRMIETRVLV